MFNCDIRDLSIDWEHPLARNLVAVSIGAYIFVKGQQPFIGLSTTLASGVCSVNDSTRFPSINFEATTQTIVAGLDIPTEPAAYSTFVAIQYWATSSDNFIFGLCRNGTTNQMVVGARGDNSPLNSGNVAFGVSYPFRKHVRLEVSGWSTASIYLDGSASATSTVTPITYVNGTNRKIYYTQNAAYSYVFNRLLTTAEDNEIRNNPYLFVNNRQEHIPISWNPDPATLNASIAHGPYPLVSRPSVNVSKQKLHKQPPSESSSLITSTWATFRPAGVTQSIYGASVTASIYAGVSLYNAGEGLKLTGVSDTGIRHTYALQPSRDNYAVAVLAKLDATGSTCTLFGLNGILQCSVSTGGELQLLSEGSALLVTSAKTDLIAGRIVCVVVRQSTDGSGLQAWVNGTLYASYGSGLDVGIVDKYITLGRKNGTSETLIGSILEATHWSGTIPSSSECALISADYLSLFQPRQEVTPFPGPRRKLM